MQTFVGHVLGFCWEGWRSRSSSARGHDTGEISAELTAQDFELSHLFLGASLKKTGHRGGERVIGGEK